MKQRNLYLGIALGSAIISAVHAVLVRHYWFVCDDAFISFRYLDHWLTGFGLVYNPGERVEGFTNLGWVLVLSPLVRAGARPEIIAPVLSVMFSYGLLALVLFFPFFTRPKPEPGSDAPNDFRTGADVYFWGALLLAANRSYGVWATSGLETRMFSFLTFAGLVLAIRGFTRVSGRALIAAGLMFGLAELTRTEAVLLGATAFGLIAAAALVLRRPVRWQHFAAGVMVFAGITAVHFLWRHFYYGSWLPNTYYVKAGSFRFGLGARYLAMFGFEYLYWAWIAPMLYLLYRLGRRDPAPALAACYILPYIGYVAAVGGDHFEYRFFDPVLPVLAALSGRAAVELVTVPARTLTRIAAAGALAVLILYHLAFPWFTETRPPAQYSALSKNLPGESEGPAPGGGLPLFPAMMKFYTASYAPLIDHLTGVRWEDHRYLSQGLEREAGVLERWIERGYLASDERLCIQTAGIIPYRTRLWTLDYFGLTNARIAHQPVSGQFRLFHDKKASAELIRDSGVDYIYIEVSERGPGDDPIGQRVAVPLNEDEVEMLAGPPGGLPLMMACSGEACLLFSSPRPAAEIEARLQSRGLAVMTYHQGEAGVFYPEK